MEPAENVGPITEKPYLDKIPEFPSFLYSIAWKYQQMFVFNQSAAGYF